MSCLVLLHIGLVLSLGFTQGMTWNSMEMANTRINNCQCLACKNNFMIER